MKTPDGRNYPVRAIVNNIYDCGGSTAFFYVALITTLMSVIVFAYGVYVIWYRRSNKLDFSFFHRIGDAYVPVPLTIVVAGTMGVEVIRGITFILLLLDWPKSWMFRNFLVGMMFNTGVCAIQLFTLSILAHIPSVFTRPAEGKKRPALYVPSPRGIFILSIVGTIGATLLSLGVFLWSGWVFDTGRRALMPAAILAIDLTMIFALTVQIVACIYYSVGFYRLIASHVAESVVLGRRFEDMLDAIRRFRNAFAMVIGGCVSVVVMRVVALVLDPALMQNPWVNLLVTSPLHLILFPIFHAGSIYAVLRSSAAFCRRSNKSTQRTAPSDPVPKSVWDVVVTATNPAETKLFAADSAVDYQDNRRSHGLRASARSYSQKHQVGHADTVGLTTTQLLGSINTGYHHNGDYPQHVDEENGDARWGRAPPPTQRAQYEMLHESSPHSYGGESIALQETGASHGSLEQQDTRVYRD